MSHSRHAYAANFDRICNLARSKDINGLKDYLAINNLTVNLRVSNITPVMKFASEGNHEIADFLMDYFPVKISDAINGYTRAGMSDQVNKLFQLYGYRYKNEAPTLAEVEDKRHDGSIFGYALSGNDVEVDKLLTKESAYDAIHAYALAGRFEKVKALTDKYPHNLHVAIDGYFTSGYIDEGEQLIKENNSYSSWFTLKHELLLLDLYEGIIDNHIDEKLQDIINKNELSSCWGMIFCTRFAKQNELLRYLSFIDDHSLRNAFGKLVCESKKPLTKNPKDQEYANVNINELLTQASEINLTMKQSAVGYTQAKKLVDDMFKLRKDYLGTLFARKQPVNDTSAQIAVNTNKP